MLKLTIPLIPITKKNHSRIVQIKGRPMIIPSKQYKDYERDYLKVIKWSEKPIDYPVNIKCLFFVPTRRRCDLTNHLESIDDILGRAGVIADDNCTIVESHDGSRVYWDKANPRTEVYITASTDKRHSFD